MSNQSLDELMDLLTPGSVWVRPKGKLAGRQVRFLMLTNNSFKDERLFATNPPQVIYVDDEDKAYNRSIESFFKTYQFHSVDPGLEFRLAHLLSGSAPAVEEDDDEDDEMEDDLDEKVDEEDGDDSSFAEQVLSGLSESVRAQFIVTGNSDPAVSLHYLADALVGYEQRPQLSHMFREHILTFRASPVINEKSLTDTFFPVEEGQSGIDGFSINDGQSVNWNTWCGVYPKVVGGEQFFSVVVGTDDLKLGPQQEAPATEEEERVHGVELIPEIPETADDRQVMHVETPDGLSEEDRAALVQAVSTADLPIVAEAEDVAVPADEAPETPAETAPAPAGESPQAEAAAQ